jgi:hypothetical protein
MIYDYMKNAEGTRHHIAVLADFKVNSAWPFNRGNINPIIKGDYQATFVDGFTVVESKKAMNSREGIRGLLEWMVNTFEAVPKGYYPFELLVRMSAFDRDLPRAQYWLSRMRAIPGLVEASQLHSKGRDKFKFLEDIATGKLVEHF